jgi:hypothetical protein
VRMEGVISDSGLVLICVVLKIRGLTESYLVCYCIVKS